MKQSLGQAIGERLKSEGGKEVFVKHDWIKQGFAGTQLYSTLLQEAIFQIKNVIRSFIRQKQKDTAYKDLEKVSLLNYGLFLKTETVEKQGDEGTELFCFVLFFSKMHKI